MSGRVGKVSGGKSKGGRPRVEFSMKTLANMVRIQCTKAECAGVIGVSEDTIDRRVKDATGEGFAVFYKKHSGGGKTSLRRAQFKAALGTPPELATETSPAVSERAPNITMQIWLGKQALDQKDRHEVGIGGPDGGPVEVAVTYRMTKAKAKK